jgi:hypothetical protein
VINLNFITWLSNPAELAVSGNNLFVSNADGCSVGEYDATTGAAINASFVRGLGNPWGLAVLGNTLFVADLSRYAVGEYNATTGAAINADFITQLYNSPHALAVGPAVAHAVDKNFNGDGFADLVWQNTSTGHSAIWFLKDGVLSSGLNLPTMPVAWHIAGVGDFAGDGNADLVWQNPSTGQSAIWFLRRGPLQWSQLTHNACKWHIAGAGDFNGDGFADLVWENPSTGQSAIWFFRDEVLSSGLNLPTMPLSGISRTLATSMATALLTWFGKTPALVKVPSGSSKTGLSPVVSTYPQCL